MKTDEKNLAELIEENGENLDNFSKRFLFESYKYFYHKTPDTLFEPHENTFEQINPDDVKYIRIGRDKAGLQNLYLKFDNKRKIIKDVVTTKLRRSRIRSKRMGYAKVKDTNKFLDRFFNLAYLFCGKLEKSLRSDDYPLIVKLKNNEIYYITADEKYKENLWWFAFVYTSYYLHIYDESVSQINRENNLNKIINQSGIRKKLYEQLKEFFDDFDFIYGIMSLLSSEQRVEKFMLMLKYNEGGMGHCPMETTIAYASEAYYLHEFSDDYQPRFIKKDITYDDILKKKYHIDIE